MKPGQNPACHKGGFLVWTSLQGVEDMGESIEASDKYMAVLDGKNAAADQIIRTARVVLQVLVRHHTTHQDLGACCYLLDRLLAPWCPLVWALRYLIVTINKNFFSFLGKMLMSHRCTALAFDIS